MAMRSKLLKFFAFTVAAGLALFLAVGVVVAATVVRTGVVMVEVQEKTTDGVSFSAPIPAALLTFGAGLTRFVDEAEMDEAREQLEPIRPMIRDLTQELKSAPSFTLVEVHNQEDHVVIVKDGRSLVIDVDNPDARVHISFPIDLAERVLNSILG